MRELSLAEFNQVSGGDLFAIGSEVIQRVSGSILGATAAAIVGGTIGYSRGGDAVGVWGLSIIGQLVGATGGALIGGVGGAIGGTLVPFDYVYSHSMDALQDLIAGKIK